MSDINITLDFITKRDKIIEMLNISIAVLFLELSIYEKTIEEKLLGEGEANDIKKYRISSLISTLEEELDNKRKTIFSLVRVLTDNKRSLENPTYMPEETAVILKNGDINWFGNIISKKSCTEAEINLAKDLELPINPLCKYKHEINSHIICRAHYDRRYPTIFRFCDRKECTGCELARLPTARDKNKHLISEDDLEKIYISISNLDN